MVLQTVQGQFTGGGYIGKGVELQTIQRNYSAFLTRQSAAVPETTPVDPKAAKPDPARTALAIICQALASSNGFLYVD